MVQKRIKGRPTKYSKQMTENLCKWIREGNTYKNACALECIHYDTFNEWHNQFPEFSVAIERSEALCKADCLACIQKAEIKDWKAAAWWLERRVPQEYSLRQSRFEHHALIEGTENARRVVDALVRAAEGAGEPKGKEETAGVVIA